MQTPETERPDFLLYRRTELLFAPMYGPDVGETNGMNETEF